MGKKLVGANCVEEYICQASGKLYADGTIILAPGAKDYLRDKGIAIVYGPKPEVVEDAPVAEVPSATGAQDAEVASADDANLIVKVVLMLKNEFGITDPEQLITLSSKVVTIVKEKIKK